jgi:hypothetical protein
VIDALTPALNSSHISILNDLNRTITNSSMVALVTFLAAFFLISVLLVAQFVVGVQRLSKRNFSVLSALMTIPRKTVSTMKRHAEELYVQSNTDVDPDDASSVASLEVRTPSPTLFGCYLIVRFIIAVSAIPVGARNVALSAEARHLFA